ncbi:MAG TPA: PSD1 and planctomycete cytochrome C domain-containing protein [Urbifossiella sp.]|jgi:mono/diheme cytochrome c family protein|nr:PSD1 and planctomycete cytochrome C domain-containing protein [Urbifossiella sp.]
MTHPSRHLAIAVALGAVAAALTVRHAAADDPKTDPGKAFAKADVDFYEKEVRPILAAHCLKCHGADEKIKGGFSLATREAVLAGGETGPAVDLKNHAASLLLKAVEYKDESLRMPPKGQLPDKDIAVLRKWVSAGLPYPADKLTAQGGPAKHKEKGGVVTEEAKRYWAFQPITRPATPTVKNAAWVKTPVDAFILAKLEEKSLTPVRPADRAALARRAYYDLWGLPPTPEQVDAFVNDKAPDAWPKLVDALLASPHYGEKWGRHWLDVVRYAETNGYERDGPKPFAWRYRDYVIRSFNADKPFDQFAREQLAGDEMPGYNPDAVIATGYYRLGIWDDEPADPKQALFDGYDDLVTVTGQGFLGITMNCARCHDHKADPFPHADYYRLLAFFRDIRPFSDTRGTTSSTNSTDITPPEQRKMYEVELAERQAKIDDLNRKMRAVEDAAIKKMPAEDQRTSEGPDRPKIVAKVPTFLEAKEKADYQGLKKDRIALEKRPRPAGQEFALAVNNCDPRPPAVFVLPRGNPHAKGAEVTPGFPQVLGVPDPAITPGTKTSGRRTVLANWVASKDNPLTARVIANRIWQGHFGRGIVPSSNDFGKLGEPPTHPELLTWLAAELVDGGWTLKRVHKLIMTSTVYQMSSAGDAANLKVDPANQRYWRVSMRRLTAEEVRDSILSASGTLNAKMFGPSVYPKISKEVLAGQSVPGQGWPVSPAEEANRRTVYVGVKRALQVPILATHDQADTDNSCPVRYTTTVPTQALGLLNGEFSNEMAAAFAARLLREAPGDVPAQVTRAVRLTTGRVPPPAEVTKDAAFIAEQRSRFGLDERTALTRYCLLLLNTNEFVYLD